ncbi:MAG: NAD(P)H-hydrate epimerase, partial [Candidatus Fimenecus sp.]
MRILTSENIKEVECLAHDSGISYLQMMENAGSYCARIIRKTFGNTNKRKVLIVCGKGKNGGDGFVIARKLCEDGYNVVVMMAMGLPSDGESSEMLSRIRAMGINIVYFDENGTTDKAFSSAQIIVDCVFGIGFKGESDAHSAALFEKINDSSATVISIDIPSGLYADCGACNELSVCADMTVAVMTLKPVHVLKP